MRKSHPIVVLIASLFLLATTSAFAADVDSAPGAGSGSAPTVSGVVNINTAEAAQLALLPRVGAKAAQRIVEYRKEHGPFRKTSDLMQVKGIGEKTYERLAPYLVVEGKTTLTAKVSSPRKPRAKASSQQPSTQASE